LFSNCFENSKNRHLKSTTTLNSGTHMAHFGEPRLCFLSKLYDNVINMRNDQKRMGLVFIENFILLVKKIFWTKFQKLA